MALTGIEDGIEDDQAKIQSFKKRIPARDAIDDEWVKFLQEV